MRRSLLGFALLGLGTLGCGGGSNNDNNSADAGSKTELVCDPGAATVLTSKVQAEVFSQPTCSSGGCHLAGATFPGMSDELTTQLELVDKPSPYGGGSGTLKMVDPGNLANSTLWLKMLGGSPSKRGPKGESVGPVMPPPGSGTVDATQMKLIKDWICTGAKAQ